MKTAAVAFGIAVASLMMSTPSFATTVTFSFSGTIDLVNNAGLESGVTVGQTVSGSMTFHVTTPPTTTSQDIRYFATAEYELAGIAPRAETGGSIDNFEQLNHSSLTFSASRFSLLELEFSSVPDVPLFASLDDLPDFAALIALFGHADGLFINPDNGPHGAHYIIGFSIDEGHLAVSNTPIPSTLPLLVSALGGLGFTRWRWGKMTRNTTPKA